MSTSAFQTKREKSEYRIELKRSIIRACNYEEPLCVATLRQIYDKCDDFNTVASEALVYICQQARNLPAFYFFMSCPDVYVTANNNKAFCETMDYRYFYSEIFWDATLAFLEDGRVLDNASGMILVLCKLHFYAPRMLTIVASCISQKQWANIFEAFDKRKLRVDLAGDDYALLVGVCLVFYPKLIIKSISQKAIRVKRQVWWAHTDRSLGRSHLAIHEPTEIVAPAMRFVRRKYLRGVAYVLLIDVCLALFPLRLPSYVLLWILEWLPEMRDDDGASCLKEVDAMKRIININQEWLKKKERLAKQIKRL